MESTLPRPEKRKAEDEVDEEPHKRLVTEEVTTTQESAVEEYEPVSFKTEEKEIKKEEEEEEEEAYEPTPLKEEPIVPLETMVPFDRLIVLHLEATCDENPTNPAAVQVTKENSEIIGKFFFFFIISTPKKINMNI